MKTLALFSLAIFAAAGLSACGGSAPAAGATQGPPPPAITGLSTPKSVAVVTAN